MNKLTYILPLIVVLLLLFTPSVYAAKVDVYLVYSGADRKLQKSIKKALPDSLKVKAYNASLLMMADYSGKQKAIAKVSSAKVVVWVSEQAHELMDNVKLAQAINAAASVDESVVQIVAAAK